LTPGLIPDSARISPTRTATCFSSSSLMPAPQVTASAWSINDVETGDFLWSKNNDISHDIASLSKMMTAYVVKLCIRQGLCTSQDTVTVPHEATILGGTTANLRTSDQLSVTDLLHGMMLPSGNDAAFTLAEYCGSKMLAAKAKNTGGGSCAGYFVKQMNVASRKLGLKRTKFLNPHGLSHMGNTAAVAEIGKVGAVLMKKPLIVGIVSKTQYECTIINRGTPRLVTWTNTNLLLGQPGVTGLKTGQTNTAGPCLCASFSMFGYNLVVTLLKCRTPEKRWSEAVRLVHWAISQLEILSQRLTSQKIRVRNLANLISSNDL
jgi:serine-type D-Ala-D-Ala carboxypeptidase (penicillin-binding protein 5/6)